jgi:hypothetical protein
MAARPERCKRRDRLLMRQPVPAGLPADAVAQASRDKSRGVRQFRRTACFDFAGSAVGSPLAPRSLPLTPVAAAISSRASAHWRANGSSSEADNLGCGARAATLLPPEISGTAAPVHLSGNRGMIQEAHQGDAADHIAQQCRREKAPQIVRKTCLAA